jgi:ribonuclease III
MNHKLISRHLGYEFVLPGLLQQAFTHRSYGSPNNERLEFLGDSILNCAIATKLYRQFPRLAEGDLSRLRASLVKEQTLAEIAVKLNLGDYLLLGEGELKSGGFRRPSILADALEAVIGAVYLDGGFDKAEMVISTLFSALLRDIDPKAVAKDPKTQLQEYLQSRKLGLPQYEVVTVKGEAHEQEFEVECIIAGLGIRSFGAGHSRRSAEQNAAVSAYKQANGHE